MATHHYTQNMERIYQLVKDRVDLEQLQEAMNYGDGCASGVSGTIYHAENRALFALDEYAWLNALVEIAEEFGSDDATISFGFAAEFFDKIIWMVLETWADQLCAMKKMEQDEDENDAEEEGEE